MYMKEVRDNCGIFGLYSQFPAVYDIYNGIDFLQHRGQEYCGIATYDQHVRQVTHHGKVGNSFTEQDLLYLTGNWGIGHVSLWERQPMAWQSRLGNISLAFSGNVINADELIAAMKDQGHSFYRSYNIEVIAKTIMEADDMVAGIAALAERIKGAYTLLVLAAEGIYATRDVYGFRPLILGKNGTRFAVSSESRALQNMDMDIVRDVHPGEIVLINAEGFHTLKQLPSPRKAHCAFEWAYTASIDSIIDGLYVQEARNHLGQALASGILMKKTWKPISSPPFPCPASGTPLATIKDPTSVIRTCFFTIATPTGAIPSPVRSPGKKWRSGKFPFYRTPWRASGSLSATIPSSGGPRFRTR